MRRHPAKWGGADPYDEPENRHPAIRVRQNENEMHQPSNKRDSDQSIRLTRFLYAAISYGIAVVLVAYVSWTQPLGIVVELRTFAVFALLVLLVNIVFYALIRSGLNLRFRDPSLTLPQLIIGLALLGFMNYHAGPLRPLLAVIYPAVFLFGVFRLKTSQLLWLSALAVASFAFVGVLLMIHRPMELDLQMFVLELIVLAGILPWCSLIGGQISKLRDQLQATNQELQHALHTISELAVRDDLTQLFNRRHLMELLARQKDLADRGSYRFCVCLIDLDYFKRINDRYGHLGGDMVLVEFSRLLSRNMRSIDYLARFGGEEFVLILVDTNLNGAVEVAERVRSLIKHLRFPELDPNLRLTASIGVTAYAPGERTDDVLARADQALYEAKTSGRDQIVARPATRKPPN